MRNAETAMPFTLHKLSFAAGELSPWLDGRTDLDKYAGGCRSLCNYITLPQGGIQKRPGMEYLGEMVGGSTTGRLVEFQTSTQEAAMLVLGGGFLAVWVDGAPALDGGLPIELATPWADADLELLRWKQINDVMWLVHPDHAPRKLVRYAADDWELTIADVSRKPPLLAENLDDEWTITTTFTVGGTPGAWSSASVAYAAGARVTHSSKTWVCQKAHTSAAAKAPGLSTAVYNYIIYTNGRQYDIVEKPLWVEGFADLSAVEEQIIALTSNRNTWLAGHVGSVWEISKKREGTDFEVQLAATGTGPIYSPTLVIQGGWSFITFGTWQGKYSIEKSEDRGATWKVVRDFKSDAERNIETEGTEELRCLMRIKWERDGLTGTLSKPLAVLSSTDPQIRGLVRITAFTDARTVTAEVLTPVEKTTTYLWKEGAWSAVQGYPRTVELHQARIVMGGTTLKPHTLFGSAVDDYGNFYPGTDADQGYRHTVAIGEKDPILWLVSERFLLIGTGAGEWVMHGEDEEKAITPEFGVAKRHSSYGSHNGGVPACFADSVSLFVQRGGTRVREFSYRFEADRYEAANLNLLADHLFTSPVDDIAVQRMPWQVVWFVSGGQLYGLTFERSQNVAAWHRHETDGEVLSVATIRGAGDEDEVWFLVDRGGAEIFIERFRAGHMAARPDDGWWQDSAVSIAAPGYDMAGAAHLTGQTITGHAAREAFGPLVAPGSGGWPFITSIRFGLGGVDNFGEAILVVENAWQRMGVRAGKAWFAKVAADPALEFMQWVVDESGGRWRIFIGGEAWFESSDDTATPLDATTWTVLPAGGTYAPEFAAVADALPPAAFGTIVMTGVTVPAVAGIELAANGEVSSNGQLVYIGTLAGFEVLLFHSSSRWRVAIDDADGNSVANFRSDTTTALSPVEATGWALTSGSATGVPVIASTVPGVATLIAGLPFRADVTPMTPEIQLANGSSRGREMRIHRVGLSLMDSRGGELGETLTGPLDPIQVGSSAGLFTGEHEMEFDGGHNIAADIVVTSEDPFPHAIRTLAFKSNAFGDG